MTKEQFRETILKHADHDYEECIRLFEETGECLWCGGDGKVDETISEDDSKTVKCPICSNHGVGDFTGVTNDDR